MVWDRIIMCGSTNLYFIRNGTLATQKYADEVLRSRVVFYAVSIGDLFLLVHDNARPHTA